MTHDSSPMLPTQKQASVLQFLKGFSTKEGRMPRMKELSESLGMDNKGVLDNLDALAKKGKILIPSGVQSIQILPSPDIFISYSSKDAERADAITNVLKTVGYSVWIDSVEILVGQDIVGRVFSAIHSCRFVIVLLSKNSVNSHWVKEELSAARLKEIESGNTAVLPVIIDSLQISEVPPTLKHKKMLRIDPESFQSGMRQLIEGLVLLPIESAPMMHGQQFLVSQKEWTEEKDASKKKLGECGWPDDIAYKEHIIHPIGYDQPLFKKNETEEFVSHNRIKLRGFGGEGFPHDVYPRVRSEGKASVIDKGFFMYWKDEPDGFFTNKEEYVYWRMYENGFFFQRQSLREDSLINTPEGLKILSLEWLEMDIVRPLLFAKNLLNAYPPIAYKVHFILHGMKGRKLHILNRRRSGFDWEYRAEQQTIEMSATIDKEIDLLETALEMVLNVIDYFNWKQPSVEVIKKDIGEMLTGRYPE